MTGSLQIKKGRYYMVLCRMVDGKQDQKWKSTGLVVKGNKRRAEEMLKEELRKLEEIEKTKPQGDILITDLIKKWLQVKKQEIRRNTYTSYEDTAKKHVIPYFEKNQCTALNLTTAQVKKYYNSKFAEGLSPESLTRHRTILRGSLDYAIEMMELLTTNPADRATLPKNSKKRTPTYYDAKQLKKLFTEIDGQSIEAPVRLAATYGLRRSEALGLQWQSVDFKRKTVSISNTAVRNGSEVIYDKTVKEAASLRTMPLTKDMEGYLLKLKARQNEMKKLLGRHYHQSDYICVWDDGRPLGPDYVSSRFGRFLKSIGLPHIRFHDLRHSSASLLVNTGYTLEEVMMWLGHASIRSTERYAHLQDHSKHSMANRINDMLSSN